jgi:hypothetical protein
VVQDPVPCNVVSQFNKLTKIMPQS